MRERVAGHLPLRDFHYLDGTTDPAAEARRYAALLAAHPLDLCCAGIGENGHLAFNDPPVADFDDPDDVKVVALEAASRRQQVGEGHFADDRRRPHARDHGHDPGAARRAAALLAIVPEARKAAPVRATLEDPVSTACPASILRTPGPRHAVPRHGVGRRSGLIRDGPIPEPGCWHPCEWRPARWTGPRNSGSMAA